MWESWRTFDLPSKRNMLNVTPTHTHKHMYIHIHMYLYLYIYIIKYTWNIEYLNLSIKHGFSEPLKNTIRNFNKCHGWDRGPPSPRSRPNPGVAVDSMGRFNSFFRRPGQSPCIYTLKHIITSMYSIYIYICFIAYVYTFIYIYMISYIKLICVYFWIVLGWKLEQCYKWFQ